MTATEADLMFDAVWERSGHHKIEMEWDVAMAYIDRIGAYNEFEAAKVKQALALVDEALPRQDYGKHNPNTGRRDLRISVGREGSPVIYVERYELHSMGSPKNPIDGATVKKIEGIMRDVAVADEADCEIEDFTAHGMGKRYTFRFWWD